MDGRFNRIEKYSVNLIKKRINFNVTRTRLGKHLTRNHCVYIYIYIYKNTIRACIFTRVSLRARWLDFVLFSFRVSFEASSEQ